MTFEEFLLRMLAFVQPVLPAVFSVVLVTTVATGILALLARNLWIDQKRFRWLGLFMDMSVLDCVRMACSWLKLVLIVVYLVFFRSLTAVDLLLFLVPGIIAAVRFHNFRHTIGNILWLVVEFAALFSTNLVCGFIHEYNSGSVMLHLVYACMAVFTALLSGFLFISEIGDLSERRQPFVSEETES